MGEPLDQRKLFRDAFAILQLYRQNGHGEVSVNPMPGTVTEASQREVTFVIGETNLEAGIGIQVAYVKPMGALHIDRVIPNSPAETAGLSRGLYIKEINGKSTRELTHGQCVMLLRGGVGTIVRLGVWDSRQKAHQTFEITRQKLML